MTKNAPIIDPPIEFTDEWFNTPTAKFQHELLMFCKELVGEVVLLRKEIEQLRNKGAA
jgi:hypothetical protein